MIGVSRSIIQELVTAQEWSLLGNPLRSWLIALSVAAGLFLVCWIGIRLLARRALRRLDQVAPARVTNPLGATLSKTKRGVILVLAIYAGSLALALPDNVARWTGTIALTVFLFQVAVWGDALISHLVTDRQARQRDMSGSDGVSANALGYLAKIALFAILFLLALDNVPGVQITTLLASLGIGGIAIALALQHVLSDLFASLSIALDQPFLIGDFITVGDLCGTVEKVGLKSTRVTSLSGEQIVFSNSDLLASRIRNYGRMRERRAVMQFGVTYQTSPDRLAAIPGMVQEIVEAQPQARFDRAHLSGFGSSSLDFEVVYHMLLSDYGVYMDTQQAIILALFRRFQSEGIEFAYPTQTLFVHPNPMG